MQAQQEILEKIDQFTAETSSKWLEEADDRFENKAWLQKSQAIAFRILRSIRTQGITQKELAKKLNVSPQQVNKWVKGKENFTLETIAKLELVLNIGLISIVVEKEKLVVFA